MVYFSMNASVTATGMTVKAQATSTLLIDTANGKNSAGRLTNGESTKSVTNASVGLVPTSTVNGSDWFFAEAAATSAKTAKEGTFGTVASGDLSKYRLANTFYLQAFDSTKTTTDPYTSTSKKIVVDQIKVTYTTEALSPCFRVLIVCGEQKVFVAPTTNTEPTNDGVSAVNGSGVATMASLTFANVDTISGSGVAAITSGNTVVTAAKYNEVYEVNVYIYFDGEDLACFTDNIPASLTDYVVDVQFALAS